MNRAHAERTSAGFTLVEILVALIVIAIGLLGIAKMEALAYSSTGIAGYRSLAAIEAQSLAAMMRANRAFWASGSAPTTWSVIGSQVIDTTAVLTAAATCTTPTGTNTPAGCSTAQMAAFDSQQWATALSNLLPGDRAWIACSTTAGSPVSCMIEVAWSENPVAVNTQGAGAGLPATYPTYTLYVQP